MTEDCKERFDLLFEKFDKLDTSIRGNGKPGLNQRVATLERILAIRWKVFVIVIGILSPIISGIATAMILAKVLN